MGHYLATENPDLAKELTVEPHPTPAEWPVDNSSSLPPVGTWVIYISRPGEGRAGKMEFPACVMHHHEHDQSVTLFIVYDVDDMVTRPQVRQVSETLEWPAWRYIGKPKLQREESEPSRLNRLTEVQHEQASKIEHLVKSLIDQVAITAQLRADLDRTREAIYGGYEDPGHAIMDIMVSFEQKLKDLTKRIGALEGK